MKIALVSPYNFFHPGGVSEHIAHLSTEFKRLGHSVTIIAPREAKGGLEVRDGFYGVGRAVTIPAGGARARLTFDVTLYTQVKALMKREQFDVVHLHEPLMPVLPYMVLLNSRAVNVATFHAYRTNNPWYTAFKPYMSFVLGRLDGRIAVSVPAREFVSQYFEGPYDIIPNGIDAQFYGDQVEPFPWASDKLTRILFIGRFEEPRKGFKYLTRAMNLVRQPFPNVRLCVVGTGNRDKFWGEFDRHGSEGFEFLGYVDTADKARWLASCDIVCAPSTRNESFGYVLLEAMASGKPVVATNIPGYASLMTHNETGLLVPPKDPQALALALVRVLADRDLRLRLGAQGRIAAQRYDWSRVAAEVLAHYQRAASAAVNAPWRASWP